MTKTFTMKAFAGAVVALVMFSFVALPIASALTTAQVSAIVSLLQSFGADAATVANVQATLNGQPTSGGSVSVPSGLTVVAYAGNGQAAKDWQTAFNSFGYTPALVVDGITGSKTRAATRYFQTNYGGLAVDGVYGPLTTAAMNAWLAGNGTPNQPPVYTGGTANAALSASTPGSATIADAANANALAFNLSAGGADLTVSSIWVTRSGLSANADLENVKILDSNGVNVGNTASSFNSNNKAKVTFTPSIVIPAGTSEMFYARVGVVDSTTAGTTFALGINSASDVAASTNVGGSFPIVGNVMTVAQVTIGSVIVAQDGSTSDNTPDVGDT
ncbi:MAG: peptidoglycan-binding protein, partial [Candidatus Nomurabacteria bacterium]|nr:peptidoglycan-binding protein [Candidatus Nomurabacteria bacterium]